jgi:hypothetical protein
MKLERNWAKAAILALPLAWVMAFLLFMRPLILIDIRFLFFPVIGFLLGLIVGGFLVDKLGGHTLFLVVIDAIILVIGIVQWIIPTDFWFSLVGLLVFAMLTFLFGNTLVLFTVFLNRFVPSIQRGQVVGIVTALSFFVSGMLSFLWVFPTPTSFAPAITAGLMLLILLVIFIVQPGKGEMQTYMVPGIIRPYVIWWAIYLTAFGLFVWATPVQYRYIFNSLNGVGPVGAELVLFGLAGMTLIFTFLPTKIGRKLVFNIGTLLLGLLCIFGGAQYDVDIGIPVSIVLSILQALVIAFIIGVGAWLIWAEIGTVRMKGRRAAFGWMLVGVLGAILWGIFIIGSVASLQLLVFPIAASLVLVSIFPLMNAREVIWNERIVEDIDVRVDSRQVSRALRDLEVDTSLRSIEGQIETEIAQLAKIRGITKRQAKELRDAGYETPTLVARADAETISQILSITQSKAKQIIANAKLVQGSSSKSSTKRKTK